MTRKTFLTGSATTLLAVGAVTALLAPACRDEACPSGETCEPTPEPTPDPADPVHSFFWVTSLEVADSGEGLDLDGDGTVDNALPGMLELINAFVSDAVEQALCENIDCDGDDADLLAQAEQFIDIAFSVDTLSWALSNPIDTGEATYVTELDGDSLFDPLSFTWYLSKTPESDESRCVMTGSLDSGEGRFGTCDLHVVTDSYGSEDAGVVFSLDLVISDAQMAVTSFAWAEYDFTGGGLISSEVMLDIIEQVIVTMNDVLDAGIPVEVAMHAIEMALPDYADVDMDQDGQNDAFSLAVTGHAEDRPVR